MKTISFIIVFMVLCLVAYVGMLFINLNHQEVTVTFGEIYSTPAAPLGLVILTSMLAGMLICGVLFLYEVAALYVQNRQLKRKLGSETHEFDPENSLSSDRETKVHTSSLDV